MTDPRPRQARYWRDGAGEIRVVSPEVQSRWGKWIAYVVRHQRPLPGSPEGPRAPDPGDPPDSSRGHIEGGPL